MSPLKHMSHTIINLFVRLMLCISILAFALVIKVEYVGAQSQALNAQIEGTVTDANGAGIPNANVTLANVETGATRTVTTDDNGFYRAPLPQHARA